MGKWQKVISLLGGWDFYEIFRDRKTRLGMLGVLVLPVVYSFIYLWAFYNPYENLRYLPVAVVNEDAGGVKDGEKINVGNELVDELKKNSRVKWEFVSRKEMVKGFHEGKYSLGVVIPKNFTQHILTIDSSDPARGVLEYHVDESVNYLAGRLGQAIIKDLEKQVDQEISKELAGKIFAKLRKSAQDLQKAANGARDLAGYTTQAEQASGKIYSGTNQLETGAVRLQKGSRDLSNGLIQLREGLIQFHHATQQLSSGAHQINGGIQPKIAKVLEIRRKIHQINDRIQQLVKDPAGGADGFQNFLQDSIASNEQAKQSLQTFLQKHPELAGDPDLGQIKSALSSALNRNEQLANYADVVSHLPQLRQWLGQISQQITDTVDQQVADLVKLSNGMNQLDQGLAKLNEKQGLLIEGVDKLIVGTQKLSNGNGRLAEGLHELGEGTQKLSNGLDKIAHGQEQLAGALQKGVDQANKDLVNNAKKADLIANPVNVKENNWHKVPNYATGFAPYFISLSLWVGAMILFTMLDLYQVPNRLGNRPVAFTVTALIGCLQAVICSAVLTLGLGIDVKLPGWLYLFTCLMSLTFIVINQALVVYFGDAGRFLAIVLMMLQLTSSGGTYPLVLSPKFFQVISPYLPMAYTVHGLRAILSSGNVEAVIEDGTILLYYFVGAYLLTQLFTSGIKPLLKTYLRKKRIAELRTI
jgi:putative membrane protein